MRSKKGFTLIELLAVIVILAIIALIAVPIVLNIINSSRESATERSAENYLTAVEQAVAKDMLTNKTDDIDGTYKITKNGNEIKKGSKVIKVSYNGKGLTSGNLVVEKGKVTNLFDGIIDKKHITYVDGKVSIIDNYKESTLLKGEDFNNKFSSSNMISIEFYSSGNLPNGYTKEKLIKLEGIDVSESQDKSIIAYKETTSDGKVKIYVYSDNQIMANEDLSNMFVGYQDLISLDLNNLNTKNVTNMAQMFAGCSSLISLNISNFDTSKVTNMEAMFASTSLTELDLSNFDTSSLIALPGMFSGCESLKKLNLTSFDTSKVEVPYGIFGGTTNLKTILVSNKWTLPKTITEDTEYNMFDGCGTDHVTVK